MQTINIAEKLSQFSDHWNPRVIAELNGQSVKVAKLSGEFDWHFHENEDELFWVISGTLEIHFRDKVVTLQPGELTVVPRGVEHKPVAHAEVSVVLFEPSETLNTGNLKNDRTRSELESI